MAVLKWLRLNVMKPFMTISTLLFLGCYGLMHGYTNMLRLADWIAKGLGPYEG